MALTKIKNIVLDVNQLENTEYPYDTVLSYGQNEKFKTISTGVTVVDGDYGVKLYTIDSTWKLEGLSHGFPIHLVAADDSGTPTNLFIGDPEGAVSLYYADDQVLVTRQGGIKLYDVLDLADIYVSSSTDYLVLTAGATSAGVKLFGTDSTDTAQELIVGDPDGAVELYYDGTIALETKTTGIYVNDTTGTDCQITMRNSSDSNLCALRHTAGNLEIRNYDHGGYIFLRAENASGDAKYILKGDPDTDTQLYRAGVLSLTCSNNVWIFSRDGSTTDHGMKVYHNGATLQLGNLTHGGSIKLVSENDSGTEKIIITGDPDASAIIYYGGTSVARTFSGAWCPSADNSRDLGNASYRWDDIWATNNVIQVSDERKKTTISGSDLGLDFINELNPVSYKFKDYDYEYENDPTSSGNTIVSGTHTYNRTHYGLIAQDVKATLSGIGKTTEEFAGYIYDADADTYALRYNEFMAPVIKAIQELTARVEALEQA